ncbi:methionine aminopeptidase [Auriculariales sp. MPI-PUGE-AT-0066]|nr:methionine aminopeptidase [Auriculariales sp. MPI-PUGE-AT-0066]
MSAPNQPCASDACLSGNPESTLECPKCKELGMKTFFCSQPCFKQSWALHKAIHRTAAQKAADALVVSQPWPSFRFTGELRPHYPLSPRRAIPAHIPKPDWFEDGMPKSERGRAGQVMRQLSGSEIDKMKVVCKMSRDILDITAAAIRPGITTDELDLICHNATIERNAYPSPLNYREFPKSICTSVNEVVCHGIPDRRALVEGDIINLDVSVYYDGYHGDVNATYPVGKIDQDSERLIRTTRECLDEAIAICKPGALFRDIGNTIEPIAKRNGCSVVRTYTGHGIHEFFHCAPNVPHFARNKAPGVMKPGMTFTIEPMINLGSYGEIHWPDNWTATTIDGKRSAQFEETLLITETGVEVITGAYERTENAA